MVDIHAEKRTQMKYEKKLFFGNKTLDQRMVANFKKNIFC